MYIPFVILLCACISDTIVIVAHKKKRVSDKSANTVRLSQAFLWIGCIGSGATIAAAVTALLIFEEYAFGYCCVIFALIFSFIILGYYGFEVRYNEKTIAYRYFFEKRKEITIRGITDLFNGLDLVITTQGGRLTIKNYMSGKDDLYEHLRTRVSLKKQKTVKKVIRFFDAVYRPVEFVVMYIITFLLAIVMWFILFYFRLFDNGTEEGYVAMVFCVFLGVALPTIVFMSIYSAKRAHSSAFWHKIAAHLFKPGYLRCDDDDNGDTDTNDNL